MYADVVVDIEGPAAPGPLTYRVPEAMRAAIGVGAYVWVPLGTREALGYVIGLHTAAPDAETKEIATLIHPEPLFDAPLLTLANWMASRYHASLAETLRCIVPEGLATRLRRRVSLHGVPDPEAAAGALERRSPTLAALVRLLAQEETVDVRALRSRWEGGNLSAALARLKARGWLAERVELDTPPARARTLVAFAPEVARERLEAEAETRRRRAPAQARALELFAADGHTPLPAAHVVKQGISITVLRALAREGLLREERLAVRREPYPESTEVSAPPPLTRAQERAVAAIEETIAAGQHDTVLLHGVTASGKTEVYLRAIDATLARGRDAIVLLPEIALTAQVVQVFRGRLGGRVAVLHSRLSSGERYDEWHRLRAGEARVVVGPRSALFAPCRQPGLIVVDEEHEPSYKQEKSPRYHARQAALRRARETDAVLVLGSATPSVESYYLGTLGEYRLVEMPERIPGRQMPTVRVVDLRTPEKGEKPGLFTTPLLDALSERLERGEQSILFLNRRGFASFILCRDCGYTACCPHCSVSLTLHLTDHTLRCHHCNHRRAAPSVCPQCQGNRIRPFGLGTERIEAEARAHFPNARVLRMDRDTTAAKDAHARLYRAFREGSADILIGTQMVAKGLDFPGVTLVGVVAADGGLNIPDFRAAERTFQLLTQVAGRAGRGDRPGEVIVQTFNPEHYAVTAARDQDFAAFFRQEIDFRRELGYPPFGTLVNVLSTDADAGVAEERARRAAAAIARAVRREEWAVEVLGPAPAPLARIKRRFRWQTVVRGPDDASVQAAVRAGVEALPASDRAALAVDVDPVGMA